MVQATVDTPQVPQARSRMFQIAPVRAGGKAAGRCFAQSLIKEAGSGLILELNPGAIDIAINRLLAGEETTGKHEAAGCREKAIGYKFLHG